MVAETFVTAEDGSGVVHMSPAFGADDYAAGQRHGLAFVQPVTNRGTFAKTVPVVGDLFVKEADKAIIAELRKSGRLWRGERLTHSYPHCWRCGTPLLYYATIVLVRAHDRVSGRDAGAQRSGRMAPAGDGSPVDSVNGWRATSTGRSRGTATGVRRSRSGSASGDPSHVEVIDSFAALAARSAGRSPPTSTRTSRPWTAIDWACRACVSRLGARPARCGASPR